MADLSVPPLPSDDVPTAYTVPSLRTRGLSVSHVDRATAFVNVAKRSERLNALYSSNDVGNTEAALDADDTIRGYAVDVWDDVSRKWHSLCRRIATYTIPGTTTTFQVEDEGAVTLAVTGPSDLAGPSNDQYLHESLFHWNGWSLVAPRPGKMIPKEGMPVDPAPQAGGSPIAVTFQAKPGTLPRLRYGRTYRFRMRAIDLAGNDVSGGTTDFSDASPPQVHRRFDPVPTPVILLAAPRGAGESVEEMVVRGNFDAPIAEPAYRHVVPPKISQLMAEEHGLFDVNGGLSVNDYQMIAQRDAATWATRGVEDPAGQGQRYYPDPLLQVPYLPDVFSRGTSFQGLPGASGVVKIDFNYLNAIPDRLGLIGGISGALALTYGLLGSLLGVTSPAAWPNAQPFKIRLVEGNRAPSWNALLRVLTVELPKGRRTEVAYSSYVNSADAPQLGVWGWVTEGGGDVSALKTLVTSGRHWMITPNRKLILTHAVRQPVTKPAFGTLTATRSPGQNFASLTGTVTVDRPSTGKLDLRGSWVEQIDDLRAPGPVSPTLSAVVKQDSLGYDGPDTASLAARHEFGDSKYRRVGYSLLGTTRYAEYFTKTRKITFIGTQGVKLSDDGVVPSSDVVSLDATTYRQGADYVIDYPTGNIARIATGTIPAGTPVTVRFVEPPITRDGAAVKYLDIPASARPAAPKVSYLIPAFDWASANSGTIFNPKVTSTRQGGGLRVYLERPWFSSGDGEQLGVVTWAGSGAPGAQFDGLLSEWGRDPIWVSAAPRAERPANGDFALAPGARTGLTLAEVPGAASVGVAPHDVAYDTTRGLWYADLQVDAGTPYFPFIRLALARYQAHALPGCELSPVVLADFIQLAPGRTASVTWSLLDSQALSFSVTGPGYTNAVAGTSGSGTSTVYASVQQYDPDLTGDLAWVDVPGMPPIALTAASAGGNTFTWSGALRLPGNRLLNRYRLVLREVEQYTADAGDVRAANSVTGAAGQRTVYVDTIPL
ncbi:hypothetical protein AB5J62_15275 [Amycolatopsis sp. cg5]|uniref:hypothetical protein n=1 Tax=Amycolatopsis sp. cg5 TaxID=3238802 RepID=UPI003525598F